MDRLASISNPKHSREIQEGDKLVCFGRIEKMKALIAGWRKVFKNDELAFYFVQLAPFRYRGEPTKLPGIWEAQAATLCVPNTGMAVTTDIGNVKDIHPKNKQDVGERLALGPGTLAVRQPSQTLER